MIRRDYRWCLIRLDFCSWRDLYQAGMGVYLLVLLLVEWWHPGTASRWLGVDMQQPQHWLRQWFYGR